MDKKVNLLLTFLIALQTLLYTSGLAKTPDPNIESGRAIAATKVRLFQAAKKILILNYYELKAFDEEAGTLATKVASMRVNVSGCDCEMMKWQGEDRRPLIIVSVNVQVNDNRIAIKASIIGDYPKEQISEKIIEDDLFNQISRYLQ